MEAHGGKIAVQSNESVGSTFTFDLAKGQANRMFTEAKPVVETTQEGRLFPEDWDLVMPVAAQLEDVPMYEAGKIRELLGTLPDEPVRFQEWKRSVIRAARHWETALYQELLTSPLEKVE